jgi:hypothetical protein
LPCIAHGLQRTILNSINKCPAIGEALSKLRIAVKGFNQSHVQRAYLTEAQEAMGVFKHKMVRPNATQRVYICLCALEGRDRRQRR